MIATAISNPTIVMAPRAKGHLRLLAIGDDEPGASVLSNYHSPDGGIVWKAKSLISSFLDIQMEKYNVV
jgi:hypothetical protein